MSNFTPILNLEMPFNSYDKPLEQVISENAQKIEDQLSAFKLWNQRTFFVTQEIDVIGDGINNDAVGIQRILDLALNYNEGIVVIIPPGTYSLEQELYVRRNTTLKIHPRAVLLRSHNGNILRNYQPGNNDGAYDGMSNIEINGGIFDCNGNAFPTTCNGIGLSHAENLILRNVTIKDTVNGHALELSGVKNVFVEKCNFIGFKDTTTDSSHYYVEAIQIEATSPQDYVYYVCDYTVTRDVVVKDCYFGDSGTEGFGPFNAGVASHGAGYDIFFDNIVVQNNYFVGTSYYAIRPFKWRNVIITNNRIEDAGGGVYIVTPATGGASTADRNGVQQPSQPINDFIVANNTFKNLSGKVLCVEGESTGYISRLIVDNNTAYTVDDVGFDISYANYCIFTNNILENVTGKGINLKYVFHSRFVENMLKKVGENGFFISNSNFCDFIGNTINDAKYYGFNVSGTNTEMSFERNRIYNVSGLGQNKYDGIILSNGFTNGRVIGNIFRTESGFVRPRYGLNIQTGVSGIVRYGNDIKINAYTTNLNDLSTNPITNNADLS